MAQQPQQQQGHDPVTIRERMVQAEWLAKFPALTVMVFLRKDIGYRLLNPIHLILTAAFMMLFAGFFRAWPGWEHLVVFTGCMFIVALGQRFRRWREIRGGVKQHSYYIGTSCLDWHRLPGILRRDRRIARFVDPIFCCGLGLLLFPHTPVLALWFIFAGICLRTFESAVHRKEFQRTLDMMDSLIISEQQGQIVEHFSESANQSHNEASPGIPTGIGGDIQRSIKGRKK